MSRNHPPPPVFAHPATPSLSRRAPGSPASSSSSGRDLLPSKARPEDVFVLLRSLIERDQIAQARKLTLEAVRRFPGDDKIRLAKQILAVGKATPNPYVQPTATAEIEWLKNPPEEARGKWVALVGSQLVGMADSVDELRQSLKSKKLDRYPLVQYVAA